MMKTKDYLMVAFGPLLVLLIPLVGVMVSSNWKWTFFDFVVAWLLLAGTTFAFRFLATRKMANLAYRAGAALAVMAGFLLTWVNLAVQVIGDENPGNALYFCVILFGLIGVGLSRFQAPGMARAAFATAFATLLVPVIAFIVWPSDFSPGVGPVFVLNGGFVLMFVVSGLLFRHAAGRPDGGSLGTV